MAYHSEVLQQERDRRRRSHLLPTGNGGTLEANAQDSEGEDVGLRRAGGAGHIYTAMAEAALAQVKNGVL